MTRRRLMKNFIKKTKRDCPYVKTNIFRSIGRVKREYIQISEEK